MIGINNAMSSNICGIYVEGIINKISTQTHLASTISQYIQCRLLA